MIDLGVVTEVKVSDLKRYLEHRISEVGEHKESRMPGLAEALEARLSDLGGPLVTICQTLVMPTKLPSASLASLK